MRTIMLPDSLAKEIDKVARGVLVIPEKSSSFRMCLKKKYWNTKEISL